MKFIVFGTPIPKGSTRAFMPKGRRFPVVTHDNAKTKPWQESVVAAAREAMPPDTLPIEGAVAMTLEFYLPKPKSAPKRVTEPLKKPDLDKLVRCVKDGLTRAGVYRDDSQVISLVAQKAFAGGLSDPTSGVPRVVVDVWELVPARVA